MIRESPTTEQVDFWEAEMEYDPDRRRPSNLSSLRQRLAQKAKREPKFRFYALHDKIWRWDVLEAAWARVRANKGAPGVDGMTVHDLRGWLGEHKEELVASLMDGTYQPQPVRGVQIPKPGGGMRQLGIPTVASYCTSRSWVSG